MKEGPDIARVAALIGEPARANMLLALMGGHALTAGELAAEAGVALPTASGHLARLRDGGLLRVERQGRHRYYALAGSGVAAAVEALMGVAASAGHLRTRPGPRDAALRHARVCYRHLAGAAGTALYDSLTGRGLLALTPAGIAPTGAGRAFFAGFGIDLQALERGRAPLCRECLDWSERRPHLAGSLGRALLARIEARGWARRAHGSRAVCFTPAGQAAFAEAFPVPVGQDSAARLWPGGLADPAITRR